MSKTVPLVVYLSDGTRKVIGEAVVNEDGTVEGKVNDREFSRKFQDSHNLYSLSVGPSSYDYQSPEVAVVEPSPIQQMDRNEQKQFIDPEFPIRAFLISRGLVSSKEDHRVHFPVPAEVAEPFAKKDPEPITLKLDADKVIAEGDWYIQGQVRELVRGNPQFTRPHISIEEDFVTHAVKLILSQGPTMQPKAPDVQGD